MALLYGRKCGGHSWGSGMTREDDPHAFDGYGHPDKETAVAEFLIEMALDDERRLGNPVILSPTLACFLTYRIASALRGAGDDPRR